MCISVSHVDPVVFMDLILGHRDLVSLSSIIAYRLSSISLKALHMRLGTESEVLLWLSGYGFKISPLMNSLYEG